MDVEGFGRGEAAPFSVTCCISASAGPAFQGVIPPDGNPVATDGNQDLWKEGRASLDLTLIHANLSWVD